MIYIFPRMTKCTFHKFGASGEVEKHDALCILPLNIVNEKIYIFIWFWWVTRAKTKQKSRPNNKKVVQTKQKSRPNKRTSKPCPVLVNSRPFHNV